MRLISCTFRQQISRTVFLTLAVSLTTGCSWLTWSNSSIRGGDRTPSPQEAQGDHDAVQVSLVEKDRTAKKNDKAEKNETELSFAFEKPVEADIGESCSDNRDCSHEKVSYNLNSVRNQVHAVQIFSFLNSMTRADCITPSRWTTCLSSYKTPCLRIPATPVNRSLALMMSALS